MAQNGGKERIILTIIITLPKLVQFTGPRYSLIIHSSRHIILKIFRPTANKTSQFYESGLVWFGFMAYQSLLVI